MIKEIADIQIDPGRSAAFEAVVAQAVPLFRSAQGCRAMTLEKVLENAGHYLLIVQWETLEDHMIHFRESEAFQQWRALAGPYFVQVPEVRHVEPAVTGF